MAENSLFSISIFETTHTIFNLYTILYNNKAEKSNQERSDVRVIVSRTRTRGEAFENLYNLRSFSFILSNNNTIVIHIIIIIIYWQLWAIESSGAPTHTPTHPHTRARTKTHTYTWKPDSVQQYKVLKERNVRERRDGKWPSVKSSVYINV